MVYVTQFKMQDGQWQIICELGTELTLLEMEAHAVEWIKKRSRRSPWRGVNLRIASVEIVGKATRLRVR